MAYPFDFIIKTGDTLPTLAAVLAGADGSPADLTDATVVFQMTDRATQTLAVDAAAVIVNAGAGSVQYNWSAGDPDTDTPADTATPGYYDARFIVTYENGSVQTFPNSTDILVKIQQEP